MGEDQMKTGAVKRGGLRRRGFGGALLVMLEDELRDL